MRGLLLIPLVACGGGGDAAKSGEQLTTLADTRTMGDLTQVEKKQLCEDFKAYQQKVKPTEDETLKMMCQAKAAMSTMSLAPGKDEAAIRGACKKEYDACVAKKEKSEEPQLDCNSSEFLGQMSACKQLTIGEITECVKDMAGVMKKMATEDLCATLTVSADANAAQKIFDKMKSPKCEVLETKCAPPTASPADAAKVEKQTIASLTDFKTRMCACKDKGCAETIRNEMNAWGEKMARESPNFQPSPATTQQVTALVNDYTNCMLKVAADDPKPSPAGSGSGSAKAAGSGSAK